MLIYDFLFSLYVATSVKQKLKQDTVYIAKKKEENFLQNSVGFISYLNN